MKKTTLPVGMHDKLFKRAYAMYQIERRISDLLIDAGFNRIETPTLEHFQVFGDEVDASHYNLFDNRGELLSLRPDITSQIGRVIASTRVQTPIKFSYSGKVFNYNEENRGLSNEHTQAGVEIVGYPVQSAMIEAIQSAKSALDAAGVQNYQFEFSHAIILQEIFETLNLDKSESDRLAALIRDKSITGLNEFTKTYPSEFDALIQNLPFLFGETKDVLEKARQLIRNERILTALDSLEVLTLALSDSLETTTLDLAQLSSMPYYTGMMFKVFGENVPDAFVSGGRYDKLFERFGAKELTAVGWAIDIDSVYQAVHDTIAYGGASYDK
ncbi:ATP phosphoribosyltransferase regulatory subunit [Streptococcus loxodontisalivarius]|uniref:ATP phosphoribosyltransferase regulatory subunit n=1 Tax=Streptococcus loxodontisalivarius TaxID=1349415 RepID=A0ABS2PQ73_9STRE|nr:ATP phosphoribosyltransferase regulatory subunit [Streptococcus loxodontisalivarius]MBM7642189.1 ATP phosphoribosyltransferase regulatory subunit [Streptococcus loxodontisalivarius]